MEVTYTYSTMQPSSDSMKVELKDGKLEATAFVVWRHFNRWATEDPFYVELRDCVERDDKNHLWGYTGSARARVRRRIYKLAKEKFADKKWLQRGRLKNLRARERAIFTNHVQAIRELRKLETRARK